jgi:deoxyribodipyrimidine photo-lyase
LSSPAVARNEGRDPSSFTNVAWIFGLHDRPWAERPVFGLVRYMSENTLTKFDAAAYLRRVDNMAAMEADKA